MQVYGRGDLDFTERLAVEFDYVENLSLARDLRILFQTIPVVLRGNGAYSLPLLSCRDLPCGR